MLRTTCRHVAAELVMLCALLDWLQVMGYVKVREDMPFVSVVGLSLFVLFAGQVISQLRWGRVPSQSLCKGPHMSTHAL